MESAVNRARAAVEAGADMIFPEAMHTLEHYKTFVEAVEVPVLANITEFGATPLFTAEELASVGVKLQLFPLSAYRAMSKAALNVYKTIEQTGSQQNVVEQMQTRAELYDVLNYHDYEDKLDALYS
jgi:methylisocitrate lyase